VFGASFPNVHNWHPWTKGFGLAFYWGSPPSSAHLRRLCLGRVRSWPEPSRRIRFAPHGSSLGPVSPVRERATLGTIWALANALSYPLGPAVQQPTLPPSSHCNHGSLQCGYPHTCSIQAAALGWHSSPTCARLHKPRTWAHSRSPFWALHVSTSTGGPQKSVTDRTLATSGPRTTATMTCGVRGR
jgi:hypothetical protein